MTTAVRLPMKTEAKKTYAFGFVLTESELRRLHDLLTQQMRKTSSADTFDTIYELRFRNGSVGYPATIDEVLNQENFGSSAITRLRMVVRDPGLMPHNSITCQFVNADISEETETNSVKYEVVGEDRDWVFLTSSQLHERIDKVRIFAPAQLWRKRVAFFPVMTLLFLLSVIGEIFLIDKSASENGITEFDSMEVAHRAGTLNDPVEAIIQVGRLLAKHQHQHASIWKEVSPMLAVLSLPVFF